MRLEHAISVLGLGLESILICCGLVGSMELSTEIGVDIVKFGCCIS